MLFLCACVLPLAYEFKYNTGKLDLSSATFSISVARSARFFQKLRIEIRQMQRIEDEGIRKG